MHKDCRVTRAEFLRVMLMGAAAAAVAPSVLLGAEPEAHAVTFRTLDGKACGRCRKLTQELLSRQKGALAALFPAGSTVCFAIGAARQTVPARTIALGRCAQYLSQDAALHVPGCPPRDLDVVEAVRAAKNSPSKGMRAQERQTRLFGPERKG